MSVPATTAAAQPSGLGPILMLGGIMVIFYFLMWRPQSKRAKEHRQMIAALSKGDEVVTSGGMLGKIINITDDYVVLKVAKDVEIAVQRPSISSALPKGTLKTI